MVEGLAQFYFSSRSQWKSEVYLGKGLSMTEEITKTAPGAQKVAAASFVALNSHQNVLWGYRM